MNERKMRIAIVGAGGKMGRNIIKVVQKKDSMVILSAALERTGSSIIGTDAGDIAGIGPLGVKIHHILEKVVEDFDILIDFTRKEGTMKHLSFCLEYKKNIVIGTTGFDEKKKNIIHIASKQIGIVYSANFSIGVNVVLKILEKITKVMGNHTDIEIIEAHHRNKIDSPSGTAFAMGETIANILDIDLKRCAVYKRKGYIGERVPKSIGFTAIRAGDIVGEHTVMFADIGERVEITHKASNRITFANGAVRAAIWIGKKKKGFFSMQDVLNLKNFPSISRK